MIPIEARLIDDTQWFGPWIVRKYGADALQKLHVKLLREHRKDHVFAIHASACLRQESTGSYHGRGRADQSRCDECRSIGSLGATAFGQVQHAGQAVRVHNNCRRRNICPRDRRLLAGDVTRALRIRWSLKAERYVTDEERRHLGFAALVGGAGYLGVGVMTWLPLLARCYSGDERS